MVGFAPSWSHQATLEASPISASQARAFVSHHLVDHRLLYLVDPVRLVASELATNALVHAQTAFSVTLAASDQSVLLTVRDASLALPARRLAEAMDLSGRGLEIVDNVALDWGTNEDGAGSKAVWASFRHQGTSGVLSLGLTNGPVGVDVSTMAHPQRSGPSGTRPRVIGAVGSFTRWLGDRNPLVTVGRF